MIKGITLATIALLFSLTSAELMPLNCRLRYDVDTSFNWFDLGRGLIYGLYDEPPEKIKCTRCVTMGKNLRDLNLFYV